MQLLLTSSDSFFWITLLTKRIQFNLFLIIIISLCPLDNVLSEITDKIVYIYIYIYIRILNKFSLFPNSWRS